MSDYSTPGLVRWRRLTDAPLLIVAVGSLPLLLLEVVRDDLTHADRVFLDVVNVIVLVAFAVDYMAEFSLARRKALGAPAGLLARRRAMGEAHRTQGLAVLSQSSISPQHVEKW